MNIFICDYILYIYLNDEDYFWNIILNILLIMNDEFEGCFICNVRVMKVFFFGEYVIDDDEFEDVLYKLN